MNILEGSYSWDFARAQKFYGQSSEELSKEKRLCKNLFNEIVVSSFTSKKLRPRILGTEDLRSSSTELSASDPVDPEAIGTSQISN